MGVCAVLEVSQELKATCVVDDAGALLAEKVESCPNAVAAWLGRWTLEKVGMETDPLPVWLPKALMAKGLPIVCLDDRHASATLKMMPNALPGADRAYRVIQGGADQEPRGLRHAGAAHRPGCAGRHPGTARERGAGAPEDLWHPLRQAGRRPSSPHRGVVAGVPPLDSETPDCD
jgi:hypothetical protein